MYLVILKERGQHVYRTVVDCDTAKEAMDEIEKNWWPGAFDKYDFEVLSIEGASYPKNRDADE